MLHYASVPTSDHPTESCLIRICAWCDCNLGTIDSGGNKEITHGMCKTCHKRVMNEMRMDLLGKPDLAINPILLVVLEQDPLVTLVVDTNPLSETLT